MTDYADAIKSAVTMRDVCNHYGIEVTRHNTALCPFHSDSKPSMHIYDGRKGWWCYVCNQGGSVIDFTMNLFGMNFRDSIRKMNDDFSLGLDLDSKLSDEQRREADRQAYLRKVEQNFRQNELKRLLAANHAAYNWYAALDIITLLDAPKTPEEEITPQYAYAVKHIDAAWEDVQDAAERLREFERRKDGQRNFV